MAKPAPMIRFSTTLFRPAEADEVSWTFLKLPKAASEQLPSRGMTSVKGAINGFPFQATLEPDGQGSHWLKVDQKLREGSGAVVGGVVTLEIAPVDKEPEPEVPEDFQEALAVAPKAQTTWSKITPIARRDWIQWIGSGKKAETRALRIGKACDMLSTGKRRICCFDRSGIYSKSMSCPVADTSEMPHGAE